MRTATKTLITGVSGFVGKELARALPIDANCVLWGQAWRGAAPQGLGVETVRGDLTVQSWVDEAVARMQPDRVFHLAGQSWEGFSWHHPWQTYETNLLSLLNLLQSLARHAPGCRVLLVSSSAVYGFMQTDPIAENHPIQPVSPYGVSKAAAEMMARQMSSVSALELVIVRSFNVIGPGQRIDFALSSFAHQIAAIEIGLQPPIVETGVLTASRDFLDVRDMATALCDVMEFGVPGEVYNVGSGNATQLKDLLARLFDMSDAEIEVRTADTRLRPSDPPVLRADVEKLKALGSWQPKVSLDATLRDMLNCWRADLATEHSPIEHKDKP